ncbi:MAG: homoserine O-acetyltransferase [Spirochaetes bacterium GWF1_31_7]|nr:MAG: homoserine O-acetyltransferase [Spirochaetes bacterium GWE1_32_154]OHD48344.1 MAG: homoserine O-acetyltransferase [Spirochaetes bacterium GWF1_31_7]OHD51621.1 MAG: homoserine O-acetyltransferase [Spirochaetes bacterium GWE2_31_10]OHD81915.1 MAG: homoserine O-acetyltransferase [Spirochaetes bacterium RIFOXYB1_FULL_32_8]HBD96346.1 homoserine O-acetyltransferase [Spirochaetia bacterium]
MSITIPYQNIKYFNLTEKKDFKLEDGTLFGPITVAYETFGTLNAEKDNAVFIIHALTGDSHVTSAEDNDTVTPGWWDKLVGKGKAIDTDKYFVISSNAFGGCMGTTGPSSINPETGKQYGQSFPLITIKDMVKVQKKLVDHLGIHTLKTVIGGSLGGMSVIEWMSSFPDASDSFIVIAASYKTSSQIIAFYEVGRNAILADPNYNGGDYYESKHPDNGLTIARMLAHITYLSSHSIEEKFGRNFQNETKAGEYPYANFGPMFAIESYLRYQGKKFVERFDANSYLYLTKTMDIYDATNNAAIPLTDVLKNVKGKSLFISFNSDWHFTPADSWVMVKAMMELGKEVTYVNLDSPYGHDAFLLENNELESIVSSFIKNVRRI